MESPKLSETAPETMVKNKQSACFLKAVLIPLVLLLVYAPWSAQLDLIVSQHYFQNGHFQSSLFLEFIYHYALIPAWILCGLSLIGLISSFFSLKWRKYRSVFLYLILTLAIGSGVLVHAVFKENWGRPRPRQTVEFGGNQPFSPFYLPNTQEKLEPAKSFSCGHCTMGFYFFSVMFLGLYFRNQYLFWAGLGLALVLGGLLSYTRIAQGGHFLSDVLISALIMWWTALLLYVYQLKSSSYNS